MVDKDILNKPYFPMQLGNGEDYVLIGYNGAMGGGGAHEQWVYDLAVLTGWFKTYCREMVSKKLINLIHSGYLLIKGVKASGILSFDQSFDPKHAILNTLCEYADAKIKVETFLTNHHLLVHRFKVLDCSKDVDLQFFIKTPGYEWGSPAKLPEEVTVKSMPAMRWIDFIVEYRGKAICRGRLSTDSPEARIVTCFNRCPGIQIPLHRNREFTVMLRCISEMDQRREEGCKDSSYTDILLDHRNRWMKYNSESTIKLQRNDIDKIYHVSLYLLKALQHPSGAIPVGGYPLMWNCSVQSIGCGYSLLAFLSAGRIVEAEKIVHFWKNIIPKLSKITKSVGLPGIWICDQCIDVHGNLLKPLPDSLNERRKRILREKLFLTFSIGLQAWQLYRYIGRKDILKKYWNCIMEPVKFLLGSGVIEEYDDHAEIAVSSGPDGKEREDGRIIYYSNPTRSLISAIALLEAAIQGSNILEGESNPYWEELVEKLKRGYEENRFNGLIRAYKSPKAPPFADPGYAALYGCISDLKTLEYERDTFWAYTWPDHGYSYVPWRAYEMTCCLSKKKMPGAIEIFEKSLPYTSTLGGIPEAVRPDGVFWKTWYPTAHATFIYALNSLLLRAEEKGKVELFHNYPREWGDIRFKGLRIPFGLIVNASRDKNRVKAEIFNESDREQSFTLVIYYGKECEERQVNLKPGQNKLFYVIF